MDAKTAMTLSNVVIDDKLLDGKRKSDYTYSVEKPLDEIMWKVVTDNPTWEFQAFGRYMDLSADAPRIRISRFIVRKDGEQIGGIDRDYRHSDGGYVFAIKSNAIENERDRAAHYRTKDAKKAIAAIKKTFVAKTIQERMNEAFNAANHVVNRQNTRKASKHHSVFGDLYDTMKTFAFAERADEFRAYVERMGKKKTLDELLASKLEMLTVAEIASKFGSRDVNLILLSNGKYLVKTGDEVTIYDDNTLPIEMRGKLGMLKLVDPEQMIEGIGCRATTEVFVLLIEAKELA